MANEATLIIETSLPIAMTVNDTEAIEKGALLVLKDPFSVSGHITSLSGSAVAGIAAEEKILNDGKTKIGVYREGIFKVTSEAITAGNAVILGAVANKVASGVTTLHTYFAGTALETGVEGDTILMELKPYKII